MPKINPISNSALSTIAGETLQRWLQDSNELALLDVREHGQYGEGHPFFAVNAPYSRLEVEVVRLVPRRDCRIVLIDNDGALAPLAEARLAALGYSDIHILANGLLSWSDSKHALFKGVNLPSKTLGELVEHAFEVPHIDALSLDALRRSGAPLVLLDGRTLDEHRKMTLPGAIPLPNGELATRWRSVVHDTTTPIVVHCAGRTRSLVGAQILRELGVPNPVFALENGTQGWALAGLPLEHGSDRILPPFISDSSQAARRDSAAAAHSANVPQLTVAEAQGWIDDTRRTTFIIDVRTAEEFARNTLPGARHAPGGQLIQATDLHIGVRNSRVLVLDDDEIRAPVIALWLRRLGFDAAWVQGGWKSALRIPEPIAAVLPTCVERFDHQELNALRLAKHVSVLDLRLSLVYRARHVRGARWSTRARVLADAQALAGDDFAAPLLLVAPDETTARLAGHELNEAGWRSIGWATQADFETAGWQTEATPDSPTDAEAIDYLFFVHDRHDGNLDAARRYLDWELGLVAQCTPDELAVFRLPHIDS